MCMVRLFYILTFIAFITVLVLSGQTPDEKKMASQQNEHLLSL